MSQAESHLPAVAAPLLRVDGVSAGYGSVAVLEDVSLSLREGEVVTILGPNGAGKTTLLRVISGVVPARSGRIEFGGSPVRHATSHGLARHGIGHVPEGRAIFPGLTVADNLLLGTFTGRMGKSERDEEIGRVVDMFPVLKERLRQFGGTLSGGEQQMLAIARALVGRPTILLLDEPSLGLSPLLVHRVFDALPQVRESGVSIIVVEQNLAYALRIADRGYVMNRGRIMLEGTAAELRESDLFRTYVAHA